MSFMCVDFQDFLDAHFQDKCVAVEFECAGCCKKAIGILKSIAPNFIRLVSHPCYCPFVKVTVFCGNNPPVEECAKEIIIKKNNIIAVELDPFFGKHPFPDFSQIKEDKEYHTPEGEDYPIKVEEEE